MFGFKQPTARGRKDIANDPAGPGPSLPGTDGRNDAPAGIRPATSDLSVNEYHYLQRFGIRPLALVMGSAVYKFVNPVSGYVDRIPGMPGSFHLNNFNRDILSAHEAALERLTGEAEALGADAVLGMSLRRREMDSGVTELMYVGTAVAFGTAGATDKKYGVLTSFLPAQDFCALLTNGYLTVRAVVGSALILYIPDYYDHMLLEGGQGGPNLLLMGPPNSNQEITGLSRACAELYQNLRNEYNLLVDRQVPGHAVMGVKVSFAREEFTVGIPGYNFFPGGMSNDVEMVGSFLLTGTLTGTLVARVDQKRRYPPVVPVLSLQDLKSKEVIAE